MPHYRIYVVADDGHISGPPHVIECTDEKEAIGKAAAQAANGKVVELWTARASSCASRRTRLRHRA